MVTPRGVGVVGAGVNAPSFASPAQTHQTVFIPTADSPWSLDVSAAIPQQVLDGAYPSTANPGSSSSSSYVTTDDHDHGTTTNNDMEICFALRQGRWSCLCMRIMHVSNSSSAEVGGWMDTTPTDPDPISLKNGNNINNNMTTSTTRFQLAIWYTSSAEGLREQARKRNVLRLEHHAIFDSPMPPLVTLQVDPRPTHASTLYVYVAHPLTGMLALWKVTPQETQQRVQQAEWILPTNRMGDGFTSPPLPVVATLQPHAPEAYIPLDDGDLLTCLYVSWIAAPTQQQQQPIRIVAGTAYGQVYWLHQTHVPVSFLVQKATTLAPFVVLPAFLGATNTSGGTASSGGFLSRLFTSPAKTSSMDATVAAAASSSSLPLQRRSSSTCTPYRIVAIVPITDCNNNNISNNNHMNADQLISRKSTTTAATADHWYFATIHQAGYIAWWTITRTESTKVLIQPSTDHVDLKALLQCAMTDATVTMNTTDTEPIQSLQVQQASGIVVVHNNETNLQLHVLALTCHGKKHDEKRLYWLRLSGLLLSSSIGGSTKTTSNTPMPLVRPLQLQVATWLNRFVAPDRVMAIGPPILVPDHRVGPPTTGIRQSIVAYLALVAAYSSSSSSMDAGMGCSTTGGTAPAATLAMALDSWGRLWEVDFPIALLTLQGLIPSSVDRDTATHGFVCYDRSGLGLRVEWGLPPLLQQQQQQQQQVGGGMVSSYPVPTIGTSTLTTTTTTQGMSPHQYLTSPSPHAAAPITLHHSPVMQLRQHLIATFWESYQYPDRDIQPPPSLTSAPLASLEEAVTACAVTLQTESCRSVGVGISNSNNSTGNFRRSGGNNESWNASRMIWNRDDGTGGGSSSLARNPMELHQSYVVFLQTSGLYKILSLLCKWQLLAIGQEIAVYCTLITDRSSGSTSSVEEEDPYSDSHNTNDPTTAIHVVAWQQEQIRNLRATAGQETAAWLHDIQSQVLMVGSGEGYQRIFWHWLNAAMEAAISFREEQAASFYGLVAANQLPRGVPDPEVVPVWTSEKSLLAVWDRQMAYWQTNLATARQEWVESVVQWALQSYSDTHASCSVVGAGGVLLVREETRIAYCEALKNVFYLLRAVKGIGYDRLMFELSDAHRFFRGLCKIALDHEKLRDSEDYALDLLFPRFANERDVETDMYFAPFVLKWHADRNLFGHVFRFGLRCPEVLGMLIQTEPKLRKYRWIHAVRQGDYDSVTDLLMEQTSEKTGVISGVGQTQLLSETKFALSVARIANQIVESGDSWNPAKDIAIRRRRVLEKRIEKINVQEELFGLKTEGSTRATATMTNDTRVWSTQRLLDLALEKMEQGTEKEQKAHFGIQALLLANTYDSPKDVYEAAVRVWCKAILSDMRVWQGIIQQETNLVSNGLRDYVLQNTVFGDVLGQSEDLDGGCSQILYTSANMERGIFSMLQRHGGPQYAQISTGLCRLLRSVTAEDHELSEGFSGPFDGPDWDFT